MHLMDIGFVPQVAVFAGAGVLAGLWLLARGMSSYRTATLINDISTSSIASLAAGEVRVSGIIEPAELGLISPLQSVTCVFYRSSIDQDDEGLDADFREERAVGFRVRDAYGDIRVFPREARWDAPTLFDERTGSFGETPAGLSLRIVSAIGPAELDRAAAIAALLSVRPAESAGGDPSVRDVAGFGLRLGLGSRGARRYREDRLAPGDAVTIVGRALPFSDLSDPAEADIALGSEVAADDTEVALDVAEARAAGLVADSPEDAWGNAAIPGFGIGRPVSVPELDPAATAPPLASTEDAVRAERRFAIDPDTLVLASAPGVPLLIAYGIPDAVVSRQQGRFFVGLLGAILAIGSAMALALMLAGGLDR